MYDPESPNAIGDAPAEFSQALADAVRSRRERAGLSQSELARMAGVSTGTLSTLEAGSSNPTVATLWAVCAVLGCDIAEIVRVAADPMVGFVGARKGTPAEGSVPESRLLHRFAPNGPVEIYDVDLEAGSSHTSEPHDHGVYEHLYVVKGSVEAGPADAPLVMRTGDYACFRGWERHVYRARGRGARLVLLLSYTRSLLATQELLGHGRPIA